MSTSINERDESRRRAVDRQAGSLACRTSSIPSLATTAYVNLRASRALQFEDRMQRNGFGHYRHRRQSEPARESAGAGYTAPSQRVFDRAQPDRQLERLRISHRLQQHRVVVRQAARLHESHAPGFGQRLDFGQRFAFKPRR